MCLRAVVHHLSDILFLIIGGWLLTLNSSEICAFFVTILGQFNLSKLTEVNYFIFSNFNFFGLVHSHFSTLSPFNLLASLSFTSLLSATSFRYYFWIPFSFPFSSSFLNGLSYQFSWLVLCLFIQLKWWLTICFLIFPILATLTVKMLKWIFQTRIEAVVEKVETEWRKFGQQKPCTVFMDHFWSLFQIICLGVLRKWLPKSKWVMFFAQGLPCHCNVGVKREYISFSCYSYTSKFSFQMWMILAFVEKYRTTGLLKVLCFKSRRSQVHSRCVLTSMHFPSSGLCIKHRAVEPPCQYTRSIQRESGSLVVLKI